MYVPWDKIDADLHALGIHVDHIAGLLVKLVLFGIILHINPPFEMDLG